jgi:hypothetical protein
MKRKSGEINSSGGFTCLNGEQCVNPHSRRKFNAAIGREAGIQGEYLIANLQWKGSLKHIAVVGSALFLLTKRTQAVAWEFAK